MKKNSRTQRLKLLGLLLSIILTGNWLLISIASAAPIAVLSAKKDAEGLTLKMQTGTLRLEVFSPRIIRIIYGTGETLPPIKSLAVIGKPARARWKVSETDTAVSLRTDELEARVNRLTGAVEFYDKNGEALLMEKPDGGKSLAAHTIGGITTVRSAQEFTLAPEEAIYGLGQHQQGLMNYRGSDDSLFAAEESR
ncbi:MAG: hypothetical protein WDM76_04050 [Limisphaerales bacterium]